MADAELREWFAQRVRLARRSGKDAYGAPAFGRDAEYEARIEGRTRLVVGPDAREVTSTLTIYLWPKAGEPAPTTRDRLTLPDGTTPPILAVETPADERGQIDHIVLYSGLG